MGEKENKINEEIKRTGSISRRNFLNAVGVGTTAVAAVTAAPKLSVAVAQDAGTGVRPHPANIPATWDLEADILVIGSGAVGLPAAVRAKDTNSKLDVLVVDCNYDIGGHAITSGGNVPLGGGTSWQKRDGIKDDPDTLFRDLVDWSVINAQGQAVYKYNDREIHRVMADNMAPCFEFLLENGVRFAERPVDNFGANGTGLSAPREVHAVWTAGCSAESPAGAGGTNLCRDLERSARKKGVKFLLNYHMDTIFREDLVNGRVAGIQAHYTPTTDGKGGILQPFMTNGNVTFNKPILNIRAKKAIIVGTGGSSGNVNFRRIADPRLGEEVPNSVAEYSPQNGSGELAIMAIGGVLWGTANQTLERWGNLGLSPIVGTVNNYMNIRWDENTPLLPKIKYIGQRIGDWQNAIMVNQAGKRFWNEMAPLTYPDATANGFIPDYVIGDWRNIKKVAFAPVNYIDAALALNEGSMPPDYSSGPQWAILDAAGVARQQWDLTKPWSFDPNLFFFADTLQELANKINTCSYQKYKMSGQVLKETVDRYNSFTGKADVDFDKPSPLYKIEKPPFYAAWNTVQLHDTYMGIRVNGHCQALTLEGKPIPGLWAGGECTGGASAHGLGRCLTQGYIAGCEAAK